MSSAHVDLVDMPRDSMPPGYDDAESSRYSDHSTAVRSSRSSSVYSSSSTQIENHLVNELKLDNDLLRERILDLEKEFECLQQTSNYQVGSLQQDLEQAKLTIQKFNLRSSTQLEDLESNIPTPPRPKYQHTNTKKDVLHAKQLGAAHRKAAQQLAAAEEKAVKHSQAMEDVMLTHRNELCSQLSEFQASMKSEEDRLRCKFECELSSQLEKAEKAAEVQLLAKDDEYAEMRLSVQSLNSALCAARSKLGIETENRRVAEVKGQAAVDELSVLRGQLEKVKEEYEATATARLSAERGLEERVQLHRESTQDGLEQRCKRGSRCPLCSVM